MENQQIKEHYINFVLQNGKRPESIYLFMKDLGEEEKKFYEYYTTFYDLEAAIWSDTFKGTIEKIQQEQVYEGYTVREKLLAFYFTLIENLKNIRTFATYSFKNQKDLFFDEGVLKDSKQIFHDYVSQLITEGVYTGEIADRTFLTERYAGALWWESIFIIRFWIYDNSKSFERTDAAIEKSVNLTLDLLGKNIADATFDFVKFLFSK
ncbi:MAG: TetR family transcriptional regulator C-terminal domain-containing protein [Thermoflexibacter sp.]|nr:TetR family transcriptional regulator C-terminal domain-containing protein [Thermoflexibacter sp.]